MILVLNKRRYPEKETIETQKHEFGAQQTKVTRKGDNRNTKAWLWCTTNKGTPKSRQYKHKSMIVVHNKQRYPETETLETEKHDFSGQQTTVYI